jgi:GTP-binding protein
MEGFGLPRLEILVKGRIFVDEVTMYAHAGNGGNGAVNFRREKYVPEGGPDGGDGGKGGDVVLVADRDTDSLISIQFSPHQRAEHAGKGGRQRRHGRDGRDCVVRVPCGTIAVNGETGEPIGEAVKEGDRLVVARGGKGGRGNWHWRSATHQVPMEHTDGDPGEEIEARLELKIVADVGLVGYPNAGKSSLLAAISDARPKVAPYPFTTLNPVIGTAIYEDYTRIRIADIPGLIEGAHEGVGLGHRFLRHIERSRFLVYVIDMAGTENRDPVADYECLRKELRLHLEELAERPFVVVANKMDLPEADAKLRGFRRKTKLRPIPISALEGAGIDKLRDELRLRLNQLAAPPAGSV